MRIKKEIPMFVLNREENILIYFDTKDINDIHKIKNAYAIVETDRNIDFTGKFSLNDSMDTCDLKKMSLGRSTSVNNDLCDIYKSYVDITDIFHLLAAGIVENKGIILNCKGIKKVCFKLHFTYLENEIVPNFCGQLFYEKELVLSSLKSFIMSPWFLIKDVNMVSFYIKNLSDGDIVAKLQNSPNAEDFTNDVQTIDIVPSDTNVIVPATFSKYVRIVLHSRNKSIAAKVWFQAQTLK